MENPGPSRYPRWSLPFNRLLPLKIIFVRSAVDLLNPAVTVPFDMVMVEVSSFSVSCWEKRNPPAAKKDIMKTIFLYIV